MYADVKLLKHKSYKHESPVSNPLLNLVSTIEENKLSNSYLLCRKSVISP